MKLNQDQINSILDDLKPSIISGLKAELQLEIQDTILRVSRTQISEFIEKWIAENVIPSLELELVESKAGLISLGVSTSHEVIRILTEEITKSISERLSNSWKRSQMIKAIFTD